MRTRASFALALMLALAAPAGAAQERDASVGYCEGCDNGVVDLTMDGGTARTTSLAPVPGEPGHYRGPGFLHYQAQGLTIVDDSAVFDVELVPSPTGTVKTPHDCTRASQLASSIRATGGKGASAYTLTTSDFKVDLTAPCARATFTVTIQQGGKLNAKKRTVTGRLLRP